MKRRILALCMAMCMTATTVFAGTASLGGLTTAYAADEESGQMTIKVSAYDYTAVDAGLADASETGVIMEQEVTVPVASAMDAASVIQKAFDTAGVSVEGVSTGYVSSIGGLGVGDGSSGWCMSYDNDDYSNWGMSYITLKDGDTIRFDYSNNTDGATDDIGNGWYGNPIVKSISIAGNAHTMTSSKDWSTNTTTYTIDGETTTAAGTEEDPFVFEVTLPANEAEEALITAESNLNSHYAVTDGITLTDEGATYDIIDGLDFSISSLGGKYKSYFTIKTTTTENTRSDSYSEALEKSVAYVKSNMTSDAGIGYEWNILDLARSGCEASDIYTEYYRNVIREVKEKGSSTLKANTPTENARVVIGLTAIGADPTDVGGYNLLEPLANMDILAKQGTNAYIYALIAFDTNKYEIPVISGGTQATRDAIIQKILDAQISDGGWTWFGDADPDLTGMAIQALAPYYSTNTDVKTAVDKAFTVISAGQKHNGGLASWGTVNSESCAQMVCALSSISLDADTYEDFVKKNSSVLDGMLRFYMDSTGGFAHAEDADGNLTVNAMATQQGTYALVAYDRYKKDKNSLYDMTDVTAPLYNTTDLSDAVITINPDIYVYNGKEQTPSVTVKLGNTVLEKDLDYVVVYSNNTAVGTAKVTVTGTGVYRGTAEKTFEIKTLDITDAKVTLSETVVTADGTEKKPEVTVTYGDVKLTAGTDYTVTYSNNVNAGTATVKVEGIGSYTGLVTTNFDIQKAADVKVTLSAVNGSSRYVKVKWNADSRATSYYVYRKSSSDKSYKKIATTKTASYTDKSVSGGAAYSYVVKPVNGTVVLGSSTASSIRVVAKTTASAKNQSKGVVISWKKVTGASKYVVIRRMSGSNKWTTVGTVKSTSITDKKAVKGKVYWYIVKAVGTNTYSKSKAVPMCRLSAPAVKKLTTTKKAVFKISYGKDKTASGYQIQYSKSKKFTGSKIYTVRKNSKVSASVRTAKAGTKYYVRIRTYKKVGGKTYYSAWGSKKSVTVKKK